MSGSEKRIKDLKIIFDSPDRYGKGLDWDGYNVHDAATVLRRYLNDLPEPVVPLDLYEQFREPLRGATKQAVGDAEGPQFIDNFDEKGAIARYQYLITQLPPLNRQLLLYILDLLAVFAAKSEENLMTSQNLSAIFQPGMLSHPRHAMAPDEYRLNQCVLIFLIENQDHFLIGMQGTAADEKTKNEVERGPSATTAAGPPLTPRENRKSGLGRSASNASAGADSVRREGKIRRHRSVSSRNSRQEGDITPKSPAVTTTPTGGGLGRSNTVPSKKSPALVGSKFKNVSPGHHSPTHLEPLAQTPLQEVTTPPSEQSSVAPAAVGASLGAAAGPSMGGRSQERLLDVPQDAAATPAKERSNLTSMFQRSPTDLSDRRQPRKLQKKMPGSLNPSAHSSTASLGPHQAAPVISQGTELSGPPLENIQPAAIIEQVPRQPVPEQLPQQQQQPSTLAQQSRDLSSEPTPRGSQIPSNNNLHPDHGLKGKKSPPTSLHSSFNDGSDLDHTAEEFTGGAVSGEQQEKEKEKKRLWRMSKRKGEGGAADSTPPSQDIGVNQAADVSNTSIASSSNAPQKSFTNESSDPTLSGTDVHSGPESSKEGKDESRGPIGWIRNKYRNAKENAEQRRTKSPPGDGSGHGLLSRGKSMDIKREPRNEETQQPLATTTQPTQPPAAQAPQAPQETPAEAPAAPAPDTTNPPPTEQPKQG